MHNASTIRWKLQYVCTAELVLKNPMNPSVAVASFQSIFQSPLIATYQNIVAVNSKGHQKQHSIQPPVAYTTGQAGAI